MCYTYSHSIIYDCYCYPRDSSKSKTITLENLKESDLAILIDPGPHIEHRYYIGLCNLVKVRKVMYCNKCLQTDSYLDPQMNIEAYKYARF